MNAVEAKYRLRKDRCHYCKIPVVYTKITRGATTPRNRATIDHRIPVCRGGKNELSNYVTCCIKCNEEKGQLTEKEYLIVLRWRKRQHWRQAILASAAILAIKITVLVRNCS